MNNALKDKLGKGEVAVGTWLTVNSLDLVELISDVGFDFLIFDTEHAPLTTETVQSLLQVMKNSATTPIVRVAWNDNVLIKLALDIGAYGLIIPFIKTGDDVVSAVRAMRYPPEGFRGIGPRRASNFYKSLQDYVREANKSLLSIMQIEHIDAIKNLEIIASVAMRERVSAFFVGPADLAASMGVFGRFEEPKFMGAIQRVLEESKKVNIPAGIHAFNVDDALKRIKQGFKLIAVSSDVSLISSTFQHTLTDLQKVSS
jgi:2-keto-3-deoxy-L-rhamnonate aldolase RhmA